MLNAKSAEPTPRIDAPSTALEPENGVEASNVTLGETEVSAETSPTARSFSAAAVNAEIAIGTFCTFSERFCAVTTISWMPPLAAGAASAGLACAWAVPVIRTLSATPARIP